MIIGELVGDEQDGVGDVYRLCGSNICDKTIGREGMEVELKFIHVLES